MRIDSPFPVSVRNIQYCLRYLRATYTYACFSMAAGFSTSMKLELFFFRSLRFSGVYVPSVGLTGHRESSYYIGGLASLPSESRQDPLSQEYQPIE